MKHTEAIPLTPREMTLIHAMVHAKLKKMLKNPEALFEKLGEGDPRISRYLQRVDELIVILKKTVYQEDSYDQPLDRYLVMRNRFPGSPRR